jgi:hypothetical protein
LKISYKAIGKKFNVSRQYIWLVDHNKWRTTCPCVEKMRLKPEFPVFFLLRSKERSYKKGRRKNPFLPKPKTRFIFRLSKTKCGTVWRTFSSFRKIGMKRAERTRISSWIQ